VPAGGPRFDVAVPTDGYVWWYLDALGDDGRHGLTLIAFLGSVFSPYYARARRRGPADPLDHAAVNVALYGAGISGWAMTERGRAGVERDAARLAIGPSALRWEDGGLTVELAEWTVPWPRRIAGRLRVVPAAVTRTAFALDEAGRHRWWPLAPAARIEVRLDRPRLRWQGSAYLDSNAGDRPLEEDFAGWTWSRAADGEGTAVLYDAVRRQGGTLSLACRFDASGAMHPVERPVPVALPPTLWRMPRSTRTAAGGGVRLVATLEDTPFYARSLLSLDDGGRRIVAVHESLSLDRFRAPWVQAMLPFRMPRRGR